MDDTQANYESFLHGLARLAKLLEAEMDEWDINDYWRVIRPRLSLEEWYAACEEAKARQTLYKVPLPAVLLGYGLEHRERVQEAMRLWRSVRGLPQRDQATDSLSLAEVRALLTRLFPGGLPHRMPAPTVEAVEGPGGLPLYDSGRTLEEEKARKEQLRRQVDALLRPYEEDGNAD